MLSRLQIKNYGLFDAVDLDFKPGLTVLTGETGAGKSMLIGAIGLILGKRAEGVPLRDPSQKLVVEAEFAGLSPQLLKSALEALPPAADSDEEEGNEADLLEDADHLVVRREISAKGKSRSFLNDTPVSLQTLRAVISRLVDLHGQHDGVHLLDPAFQLEMLDQYAGITDLAEAFGRQVTAWRQLGRNRAQLEQEAADARRQLDYFTFQMEELDAARISTDEEQALESDLKRLENAEAIGRSLSEAHAQLSGETTGAVELLSEAYRALRRAAEFDEQLQPMLERLEEVRYNLNDLASDIETRVHDIEHDPARLQEVQDRLNQYNKLKFKYGVRSAAELLSLREDFAAKVEGYASIDDRILALKADEEEAATQLLEQGLRLEKLRQEAASELAQAVNAVLPEVGLTRAAFAVRVERLATPSGSLMLDDQRIEPDRKGLNRVVFQIRTNPGQLAGPLSSVASGGEISRVMLALKTALAEHTQLAVLIFDEIDTGISGEVALRVGRVMQQLAEQFQLITITHLPQIAGKGSQHYYIYKEVDGERTVTQVRLLQPEERVLEIAKMIAGENPTAPALASARELLSLAT